MVDSTSLNFGVGYNGYNELRTIVVTGVNLTDDVTLSITGSEAIDYIVKSSTTITPEQAAEGAEVIISFFPMNRGTRRATLVLSSPGANTVSIPMTGYGIKTSAFLIPDDSVMTFETSAMRPVTRTLVINRHEFDGWLAVGPVVPPVVINPNIAVTLASGNTAFSLGSINLISTDALTLTVSITYCPLLPGTHTSQLLITGNEAHPVTVELTGTATAPTCDIDGNGVIDIADVTAMIDILLRGNDNASVGDVDGDGLGSINDVTLAIDYILNGK